MDNADIAAEYVDEAMKRALESRESKKLKSIAAAESCDGDCRDCGIEIPEQRRKLVATDLCVECQEGRERQNSSRRIEQ